MCRHVYMWVCMYVCVTTEVQSEGSGEHDHVGGSSAADSKWWIDP